MNERSEVRLMSPLPPFQPFMRARFAMAAGLRILRIERGRTTRAPLSFNAGRISKRAFCSASMERTARPDFPEMMSAASGRSAEMRAAAARHSARFPASSHETSL